MTTLTECSQMYMKCVAHLHNRLFVQLATDRSMAYTTVECKFPNNFNNIQTIHEWCLYSNNLLTTRNNNNFSQEKEMHKMILTSQMMLPKMKVWTPGY